MASKAPQKTKDGAFDNLYPAYALVEQRESCMVDLPGSAAAYFPGGGGALDSALNTPGGVVAGSVSGEDMRLFSRLPRDRIAKYRILEIMAEDPTIDCAVKMHLGHALSVKSDGSGEIISIDGKTGAEDPIVLDLRQTFQGRINRELNEWAYNTAIYGTHFVRVYGEKGVGITNVRSDYYTHARHVKKFEKAGQLAGFSTTYQGTSGGRQLRLMPPWAFVEFTIPTWRGVETTEPQHIGAMPIDLSLDSYEEEALVESQEYGASLIETAYQPWLDFLDGLASLKMSRRNAARLERLIGVNTGHLDPARASKYLDMIARNILNSNQDMARQSWMKGDVQTVANHIFPTFGEKGRLDINTVQGTPDINGLEDMLLHVKRLGGALGIDPSMLGFGDFLSGGLGDGGFFRVSVMAAMKARSLQQAIQNGVQRLCELHVAYKHGKVFLPDEQPWKLTFASVSSALDREEQDVLESRSNMAGTLSSIIATVDQDFAVTDRRSFFHFLWSEVMKQKEESFESVFPEGKKPEPVDAAEEE